MSCIISDDFHGGTPSSYRDEENEDFFELYELPEDISLLDVIHLALVPELDNVFVWITAGAEKSRYITGHAIAIDHTGTILDRVSLDDIYDDTNWTKAEY